MSRKEKPTAVRNKTRKEELDEAEGLLERLREKSRQGIPIVVEGKRDAKALKSLGVEEDSIVKLKGTGRKTLGEIAWDVATRTTTKKETTRSVVIILTDPDREGMKMAHQVSELIEAYGAHPDLSFMRMTRLFGRGAVEELEDVQPMQIDDFAG